MSTKGSAASRDIESMDTNPTTVGPATIKFTTAQALLQAARQSSSEVIYVEDVSTEDFASIEEEKGERPAPRLKNYSPAQRLLIIVMPILRYERSHSTLNNLIINEMAAMGLEDAWGEYGHATQRAEHDGGVAEADSSGGPMERDDDIHPWQTLVIEAGYSQSLTALRQQMRWWFAASQHKVKIVLLIKLDPLVRGKIIIEQWKEFPNGERAGATTTRFCARLEPVNTQHITIQKTLPSTEPGDYLSYGVTGGPLRLSFVDLFLRAPKQGEGDVVLTDHHLQRLAASVGRIRY
ncbi:unnamed protein product [Clonostachys byssicola]|uniref:Uncharacterized protein n=1 Tax=Clonostachys byssicola TaxID=160290 RepID=A0A9N9URK9_9HYPO|nr:unnamed protein product [Clonostachys byssicola]